MIETRYLVVFSDLAELPRVLAFVRRACQDAGLDADAAFACELATDEACTNVIEHAYQGDASGEIRILCAWDGDEFLVRLHDRGRAFDPNAVASPTLAGNLASRRPGGLGLHFIYSLMDDVQFRFDAEKGNTLVMKKHLGRATGPEAGAS